MPSTDTITVPRDEYEAMKARLEDLDDIIAGHAAHTGVALPHEFAMRVINGEHPLRVWREYRGMTATALAEAANVGKGYLSEIETGKKPGSIDTWKALSGALCVPMDALLP